MGIFDKLKEIARPYAEDYDYEDENDLDEGKKTDDELPTRSRASTRPVSTETSFGEQRDKVVNIHATTQLSVVVFHPDRFDVAGDVADHLREKHTVVLNLENTQKEVSRRLLDFLSGVAYANDGKIKQIANATYLITPFNVEILGDLIDELENNGLYF